MSYSNKYDAIFQWIWCHIPINMMSYSNKYDAIFQWIWCHTYLSHARTEPVRTPKFSSDNASDKRQFYRLSHALSLPVRSHPKQHKSIHKQHKSIHKQHKSMHKVFRIVKLQVFCSICYSLIEEGISFKMQWK